MSFKHKQVASGGGVIAIDVHLEGIEKGAMVISPDPKCGCNRKERKLLQKRLDLNIRNAEKQLEAMSRNDLHEGFVYYMCADCQFTWPNEDEPHKAFDVKQCPNCGEEFELANLKEG